jgi:hypothetical protein
MSRKKRGAARRILTKVPSSGLQHHHSSEEEIQNENLSAEARQGDIMSQDIILAVIRQNWNITEMVDMIAPKTWTKGLGAIDVTWELETLQAFRDLSLVSKGKEADVKEKLTKRWDDRSHNHNGFKQAVGNTWHIKQRNLREDLKWLREKFQREAATETEEDVQSQNDLSEANLSEVDQLEARQSEEQREAATGEQNETTVIGKTRARTRDLLGMPSSEQRVSRRQLDQSTEETRDVQTVPQSVHGDERMDVDDQEDQTPLQEAQQPSPSQLRTTQGSHAAPPISNPESDQPLILSRSDVSNRFQLEWAVGKRRELEAELEVMQQRRDTKYLERGASALDIAQAELAVTEAQKRLSQARTKILELQDYS